MTREETVQRYDYVVIGAGIIGLTIARELHRRFPLSRICILEKEPQVAMHASGRNSGVLHAGFYYSADSLKAKFAREGNLAMTRYCEDNGLKLNRCGKLIVANDASELAGLAELKRRGDANGVELRWMDAEAMKTIDPNAKSYQWALYSPNTSTVDPVEICRTMQRENERNGVAFRFDTAYIRHDDRRVETSNGIYEYGYLINAAGLYADKIAQRFGFGTRYTILPFKGIFLKYDKNKTDVRTNIYPVPNMNNPFLGVHFTKTVDGDIKIGPTAIPVLWREQYKGLRGFKLRECLQIGFHQARLFLKNSFRFRNLAIEEVKKYRKRNFIGLSLKLIRRLDASGFGEFMKPGIRAQLLDKHTLELVQDFVLEGDDRSIHVLNAVSPAFTCSIPFAEHVVDEIVRKRQSRETPNSRLTDEEIEWQTRSG